MEGSTVSLCTWWITSPPHWETATGNGHFFHPYMRKLPICGTTLLATSCSALINRGRGAKCVRNTRPYKMHTTATINLFWWSPQSASSTVHLPLFSDILHTPGLVEGISCGPCVQTDNPRRFYSSVCRHVTRGSTKQMKRTVHLSPWELAFKIILGV